MIVHVLAVLLVDSKSEASLAPPFRTAMLTPELLMQQYIPTMPDDERVQFMEVLGGGWYECENGYVTLLLRWLTNMLLQSYILC